MEIYQKITEAVVGGKNKVVQELVPQALAAGAKPQDIVEQALVPGMSIVGERFKRNEVFVPEMLVAARAMKTGMALLEPLLVAAGIKPKYTALIGTVQGDLHDIGKNLVAMMWKGANINVIDLGSNVSPEKFADAVAQHRPNLVGLSALLTTTMPAMRETIAILKARGLTAQTKILIGGAPVTQQFADEIGADGYAPDAASAVDLAMRLLAA